jgi:hypothetical protein
MARLRRQGIFFTKKIDIHWAAADDGRMTEQQEPLPQPEESPLWRTTGITPTFEDDSNAPAVDLEKLRRYYRMELNESGCEEVRLLVGKFRSWYIALGEVVRDRAQYPD